MVAERAVRQSAHVGVMVIVIAVALLIRQLPAINLSRPAHPILRERPAAIVAPAPVPVAPPPAAISNPPGDYQLNWPGEVGDLEQWIVIDDSGEDAGSQWTNTELRIVHNAIRDTIAALDSAGLDGHQLLAGYRFQRAAGRYLAEGIQRQAQVNHEPELITLAGNSFISAQGFVIYHELGHVVDRRLGRRLSSIFQAQALQPARTDGLVELEDGYWMREQAHDSASEAAADAFALWVMVEQEGRPMPSFPTMPETVDPPLIFELVRMGLR